MSNIKFAKKCCTFKQSLKEATHFINTDEMKQLKALSPVQQRFFEMRLRNALKKPQESTVDMLGTRNVQDE